jgi:manganese efflux pump family protein
MSPFGMLAIAIALAMDAFAVAIVTGLTVRRLTNHHFFRLAFHFGIFQSGMFAGGWFFGNAIHNSVERFDHWIAFTLLTIVGVNIIRESLRSEHNERAPADPTAGWQLVMLSLATSVDALAVGFSLAMINTLVTATALAIGLTTAAFTLTGMLLGHRIGRLWGRRVELLGGAILIVIGSKILLDHLLH